MRKIILCYFIFFYFLSFSWLIWPDVGHCGDRLSLEAALRYSLEDNPEVKAVLAELEGAQAKRIQARSAFFPKIDIEEDFLRTNNPVLVFMEKLDQELFGQEDFRIDRLNDPTPRSDWALKLILTQPIFNRGKEIIGNELAQKAEEIIRAKKRAIQERVAFETERAYLLAILATQKRVVLEKAIGTAKEGLEIAKKRYRSGKALKSDVLSSEARLMRLKQDLALAKSNEKVAMADLNRIMGQPQSIQWELDKRMLNQISDVPRLETWLKKAKATRPEILISKKMVDVAAIHKKGAKLNFLPSINLRGNYEFHGEDPLDTNGESWSIMAKVSFNIFNGLSDRGRLIEASADLLRAKAQRDKAVMHTEFEVRGAYYEFLASNEAVLAAQAEVERAQEALRILRTRYSQGLALMVEVLGAEDVLKKSELRLAEAKYRTRLSYLKLRLFSGTVLSRR